MNMKSYLLFIVTWILIGSVASTQAETRESFLKSIIGSVKVRKGSSPIWRDARPNMALTEKDAVRTFVESQVEIMTPEGTVLRLDENTVLELSTLRQSDEGVQSTKVKILNGTILANVKKLVNTGSKFEFETPTAVASIRGTTVGFDVSGEKTLVKVYEGEVMVLPRGSLAAVSVKTNQMTTIVKGQKNAVAENLSERDKNNVVVPPPAAVDSVKADTTKKNIPLPDSAKSKPKPDSIKTEAKSFVETVKMPSDPVAKQAVLFLKVSSPTDGQRVGQAVIPITGTTTPGAEVTVSGIKCQVTPSGSFSGKIPIPDEENQLVVEIEATLGSQSQKITRKVIYQSDLSLTITSPQNGQVFTMLTIPITGQVIPAGAELVVYDTKIPLASSGKFSGSITIPQEEGTHAITFESSFMGITKNETRTIVYKQPLDDQKPVIAPLTLPTISKTSSLPFSVMDRTTDDEITFYKIIDGSKESETGRPNSNYNLDLEEGTHTYTVYAEDKAKNRSQQVSGIVAYLSRSFTIKMRKPLGFEIIHVPPGTPNGTFNPQYTVQFTLLNVPDNDRKLIKQVSVTNLTSGQTVTQRDILDLELEFDIDLKRGQNKLSVDVKDINDRVFSVKDLVVDVR